MLAGGGGDDELRRVGGGSEGREGGGGGGMLRDVPARHQGSGAEGRANRAPNARRPLCGVLWVEVGVEGTAQEVDDEARRRGLTGDELGQFVAVAPAPGARVAPQEQERQIPPSRSWRTMPIVHVSAPQRDVSPERSLALVLQGFAGLQRCAV